MPSRSQDTVFRELIHTSVNLSSAYFGRRLQHVQHGLGRWQPGTLLPALKSLPDLLKSLLDDALVDAVVNRAHELEGALGRLLEHETRRGEVAPDEVRRRPALIDQRAGLEVTVLEVFLVDHNALPVEPLAGDGLALRIGLAVLLRHGAGSLEERRQGELGNSATQRPGGAWSFPNFRLRARGASRLQVADFTGMFWPQATLPITPYLCEANMLCMYTETIPLSKSTKIARGIC